MALPQIRVHGRNISEADARKAGEGMCGILNGIGELLGCGDLRWSVSRVDFMCDGCGHRQAFEAPRYGWTHRGGDDFCSACSSVTSL